MIRIYLNMYNIKAEKTVKLRNLTKRRRWLSSRKVWVSKAELKHTNDKVTISIYVYDRINSIIMRDFRRNLNDFYIKNVLDMKGMKLFHRSIVNKVDKLEYGYKDIGLRAENSILSSVIRNFKEKSKILNQMLLTSIKTDSKYTNVVTNCLKLLINKTRVRFIKKILKREMALLYFRKFLWLNTLKYKNTFIKELQKLIGRLYNKKVVLNIVMLKNYYLNTSILTQLVAHTSKNRKNRIYKTLSETLASIKIPVFRRNIINKAIKRKEDQNIVFKYNIEETNNDNLNIILKNYNTVKPVKLESSVIDELNNKVIIGVRLEAAGRLTKRFTAQRAVKKLKYIGTLKNIDSSFKGLSTQVIRNTIDSNIQYSKASSQNRIGSFGIKGWINSI